MPICSSNCVCVIADTAKNHPAVKDKDEELPPLEVLEARKKELEGSIKETDAKLRELYNEVARVKGEMTKHCASLQDTQSMINRHNDEVRGRREMRSW